VPKPPRIDRPSSLHVTVPESVRVKLDLFLFSELEGRVPQGAYQRFLSEKVEEIYSHRRLDLSPYGFQEGFWVSGPKEMIDKLEERLKG